MRQTLKIGIVTLVVAAMAMSGLALAQTDDSSTNPPAATEQGQSRIMENLGPLVEDGTLTQAQAEAVAEVLADGSRGHGRRGPGFEGIAEFLGTTVDEIRQALQAGSTLADVAADNGSSADALIDYMVGEATERLDQAVADGKIDEAGKAERLAEITERITDGVNGEFEPGDRGPGRRGPGGPGGERGPSGPEGEGTSA